MELLALGCALLCGLAVKPLQLPPLAGYLVAGFLLHLLGFTATESIEKLASLGITLMLFTIGLKLDLRSLASREILIPSIGVTLLWCALVGVKLLVMSLLLGG